MPTVLRQDLKSKILISGGYNRNGPVVGGNIGPALIGGANMLGADANAPTLRDANGATMVAGGVGGVGSHYRLPAGVVFTAALMPDAQSGGKKITFMPDDRAARDRCIYLPYSDNYITSAMLPAGANAFFTDNLSGCAVYVAQCGGDLIVFHANARRVQGASGDAAATLLMQQMRDAAMLQYAGWLHNGCNLLGGVEKATYFTHAVNTYTTRKTDDGRTNVATLGEGCNVIGLKVNNHWEFYYQTWALVSYDRPGAAAIFKGASRAAALGAGKILACERFLRV